jgi:anion-transporting  ArsA/GET3 family ATPase
MGIKHSDVCIVTGKGGVGKTTYAAALAMRSARAGKRTLLVEVNGGGRSGVLLGMTDVGPVLKQATPFLWVVDIQPQEAMREYALMTLRFESLYKTVFENAFAKRFLRLIPSLSEIVMLGKIWFHSQETHSNGALRFETIVVDAPATGHAIALLRAPRVIQATVPPGPLKQHARAMVELLQLPSTRIHPVCTAEDMPVTEVCRTVDFAKDEGMHLGPLCVNKYPEGVPQEALDFLQHQAGTDSAKQSVVEVLAQQQRQAYEAQAYVKMLPEVLRKEVYVWPVLRTLHMGPQGLDVLIQAMDTARAL